MSEVIESNAQAFQRLSVLVDGDLTLPDEVKRALKSDLKNTSGKAICLQRLFEGRDAPIKQA